MKKIFLLVILFVSISVISFSQNNKINIVKKEWGEPNISKLSVEEIFETHKRVGKIYKKDKKLSYYNDLYMMTGLSLNIEKLNDIKLPKLPKIDVNDPYISSYFDEFNYNDIILADFYVIKKIAKGSLYEDVKSGMKFNTSFGGILKSIDYEVLTDIFNSKNDKLKKKFLRIIHKSIRYNGLTPELVNVINIAHNSISDSKDKEELMSKYESYKHLLPGELAPDFALKNYKGKEYKLSDFRGKVVVIDVWATWCGGCILKLPDFLKIRDSYKGRDDIEFMVISIDGKAVYNKWKYSHPRYNLMDIISLIASEEECDFSKDYNITGIPRYIVIDKEGKIVSVYAPSPGEELRKMIENTLNK